MLSNFRGIRPFSKILHNGNAAPGSLIVATLGKVSTKAKTDKDGK